jgi:Tol biopolymer transport system component
VRQVDSIVRCAAVAAIVGVLVSQPAARQAERAETLLQAAMTKALVEGKPAEAIPLFEQVLTTSGVTPAVSAKALLHLGDAYGTLCRPEARATYERLIRDFPKQPEAAAAAGRLNAPPRCSTQRVARTIWSGSEMPEGYFVAVSPDARSLLYVRDEPDGSLILRDVVTGRERPLTKAAPLTSKHAEFAVYAEFSPDGTRVAYDWRIQTGTPQTIVDELRVIDLRQPGIPTPDVLHRDEQTAGYSVRPVAWAPGGDRIYVVIGHGVERTRQLGVVDTKTRTLTVLKSLDWRNATGVALSPDGRHLAFDLPAGEQTGQRDIFVLAVDGSRESLVVGGPGRDEVVGWSPDGTRLLFTRDRLQLWERPMRDGAPHGPATLLKADARGTTFKLAANGDLFEFGEIDGRLPYMVTVDFATGKIQGPATMIASTWPAPVVPQWSPDGTLLSAGFNFAGDTVLSMQSVKSGDTRLASLPLSVVVSHSWTPDGRALVAHAADLNGRDGIFRIDVATSEVTPVLLPPPGVRYSSPQLSSDGSKLFFTKAGAGGGRAYIARDLVSGQEHEMFPLKFAPTLYGAVSPDGKYVGAITFPDAGDRPVPGATFALSVISTSDGKEREVFRVAPPAQFLGGPVVQWTPDSRFMVVRQSGGGARALWAVPIDGGPAHQIDVGVPDLTGAHIRLGPAGQLGFIAGQGVRREVRVVESFLPPAKR